MQLTSDMNVFAHVWGQKADTSSSYCDNIQPHDKTFQFLSNVIRWDCFFLKLLQIRTSNFSGSAATHWRSDGKYYMGFVGNLLLFQQWKNFDNPLKTDKVISWVWCTTFLGHSVVIVQSTSAHPMLLRQSISLPIYTACLSDVDNWPLRSRLELSDKVYSLRQ